ncbi:MAG: hypothetical protein HC769_13465 [Cyanobacteria bacterium CRU_2_1]|nr:hypothetical protein [Cyanobacteria bacterium CRU_2_1]
MLQTIDAIASLSSIEQELLEEFRSQVDLDVDPYIFCHCGSFYLMAFADYTEQVYPY